MICGGGGGGLQIIVGGQNQGRGGTKAKQGELMSYEQGVNEGKGKGQSGETVKD